MDVNKILNKYSQKYNLVVIEVIYRSVCYFFLIKKISLFTREDDNLINPQPTALLDEN